MPAAERVRTTKACVACSIRKIKCDGNDPCAHCIRFFDGECFYTTAKKRGPPKGCPARGGHRKRQQNEAAAKAAASLDTSQDQNQNQNHQNHQNHSQATESKPPVAEQLPPPQPLLPQINVPVNNGRASLPSPLVMQQPLPGGPPSTKPTPPDTIDNSILSFGFSPAATQLTSVDELFGSVPSAHRMSIDGHASNASSPSMSYDTSFAGRAGLTSSGIDDLLIVYETFIHPHWPVIYVPALRSLRSLETQQPLVFDAVLAISAANADSACSLDPSNGRFSTGTGRSLYEVCEALTESVRHRVLGSMNCRDHMSNLQAVQALIMISLVDQGCGRTSLAYQMCGFACRMAVDIGLHTHFPDASRPKDTRHHQERSRTLWACFILDKSLAAVSQRPPCLRLADIDAPRPSIMERDELDLWMSGGSQHFLRGHAREIMENVKAHSLSSFNSWVDVMAILELILSQVYRPSTRRARMEGRYVEGYEETVIQLDADLQKWRESLPPELQWSDDDENAHMNVGQHLLTCRGWYNICLLLLHRPQVPYLDTPHSPGMSTTPYHHHPSHTDHMYRLGRLPNGADASRKAATAICKLQEAYERTFRMRKFSSSWVYLVFQAATVHAGLASHTPTLNAAPIELSQTRAESVRRLEQCIHWLDEMAKQWVGAGRHVEILRKVAAVGARTRPPSPSPVSIDLSEYSSNLPDPQHQSHFDQDPALSVAMNELPLDANAWMLLWASMPTAGDDFSLWQQCIPDL